MMRGWTCLAGHVVEMRKFKRVWVRVWIVRHFERTLLYIYMRIFAFVPTKVCSSDFASLVSLVFPRSLRLTIPISCSDLSSLAHGSLRFGSYSVEDRLSSGFYVHEVFKTYQRCTYRWVCMWPCSWTRVWNALDNLKPQTISGVTVTRYQNNKKKKKTKPR